VTDLRWASGAFLFLAVASLYLTTYSSVPTSDGYAWISHIEGGDRDRMLPAYHALPMYVLFRLRQLFTHLGWPIGTLTLIQAVNAALAATAAVLLHGVIRSLGGSVFWGWLGGGLLALSFGCWYFANGELHHFPLVVSLVIFYLLVRARVLTAPWGPGFPIGLGSLNALAIMFHQESVLFGFAAIALLVVGRPWRQGLRDGLAYILAGSVATVLFAVTIAVCLRGVASAGDFWRWFLWLFDSTGQPQPYTLGGPVMIALKVVKGKLTALVLGTQVVTDASRDPALLRSATVRWLLAGTALAYGLMAFLLIELWRRRRQFRPPFAAVAVACVVWILSYDVLLHSWFWPTAPEYHVSTLPPLILLLLLGPIIAATGGARPLRWRLAAAALLALTGAINIEGGMLPWYRFGQFKGALASGRLIAFRPDDFFVSFESGLDHVFTASRRHLAMKEAFALASKSEGLAKIQEVIDGRLAQGHRVFVFNLVPGPFTLLGLNQTEARRGAPPLTAEDFEEFRAGLARRYAAVPVLSYWEEAKTPLYLFGESSETLWELRSRAAAR
jgi:hypothetical protein